MSDVLSRCRRLGFPVLIATDKTIGDMDSKQVLWLFYYLLEIYEPSWTHAPTKFTKSNYKPMANAMRLLELGHKCPKSKELKRPSEHKRSLTSSLGAVLDKLEAKYPKLYTRHFQHPSVIGMQQTKSNKMDKPNPTPTTQSNQSSQSRPPLKSKPNHQDSKPNKGAHSNHNHDIKKTKNTDPQDHDPETVTVPSVFKSNTKMVHSNKLENRTVPSRNGQKGQKSQKLQKSRRESRIQPPRATSKDLVSSFCSVESKKEETEEKAMEYVLENETKQTPKCPNAMEVDTDDVDDVDVVDVIQQSDRSKSMKSSNGPNQLSRSNHSNQSNHGPFHRSTGGIQRSPPSGDMGTHSTNHRGNQRKQYNQHNQRSHMNQAHHRNMNMNQGNGCNLNAYDFQAPSYRNETVRFHVDLQEKDGRTMTEKYEALKKKETEKADRIRRMKEQYDGVAAQLWKQYRFKAKPFQQTSSTDYAVFQLESIQQKLESEKSIKREKSVELLEEDGIDRLLNSLNNQVQNWSHRPHS